MLRDILLIKKALAEKLNLPTEGRGLGLRIVGVVPDGSYTLTLEGKVSVTVEIKNDTIMNVSLLPKPLNTS